MDVLTQLQQNVNALAVNMDFAVGAIFHDVPIRVNTPAAAATAPTIVPGELCNMSFLDHHDDNYPPIWEYVSQ